MPRVDVELRNNDTGATHGTLTNSQGTYRFSLLPPGTYTVTAKTPNFALIKRTVTVAVGQVSAVDLRLSLQASSVAVEVKESTLGIQTDTANLSTAVTAQQLATLP